MKEKDNKLVNVQKIKPSKYKWAVKLFVLSLCLSTIFSLISQTVISSLGLFFSIVTILIFILVSIIFDMIGIAVTSCEKQFFINNINSKTSGAKVGLKLCNNAEKVCSFCADMIGDICGILSGAGGGYIILILIKNLHSPSVVVIISTLISATIAGITIFGKAIMKEFAIKNANSIVLKVGFILENTILRKK